MAGTPPLSAWVKSVCDIMRRSDCARAFQYAELTWTLFLRILESQECAMQNRPRCWGDFQATLEREAALGLSPDEIAFYDALANHETVVLEPFDAILKQIVVEIVQSCATARSWIGRCTKASARGCASWSVGR